MSVGATFLPLGHNVKKDQEIAVTSFGSGGGFSNIYTTPDYQADAVATYFKTANLSYASYESSDDGLGYEGPTNIGGYGVYNRIGRFVVIVQSWVLDANNQ